MKHLVRMKFGSHLYGTNTPASDLDFKSVHVPPARDILLQRTRNVVTSGPQKAAGEKNNAGDVDEESYALHRYMQLLAEGQTVALDMLFAPSSNLIEETTAWASIVSLRSKFLTKKSASFVGYCRTQANKYGIRGSRVAAARDAMELFARTLSMRNMGNQTKIEEIAALVEAFATNVEHCSVIEIEQKDGSLLKHFECCNKKVPFTNTVYSAYVLYKRIYDDYGQRARMAQENQGIDWKALSHAVRVGREAVELLDTWRITFPLPYADRILAIKLGKIPYEEVAAEIEELLEKVEASSLTSTLPDAPDLELMDTIVANKYRRAVLEEMAGL